MVALVCMGPLSIIFTPRQMKKSPLVTLERGEPSVVGEAVIKDQDGLRFCGSRWLADTRLPVTRAKPSSSP